MLSVAVPPPAQSTVTPLTGRLSGAASACIRSDDAVVPGCATGIARPAVVSMTESTAAAVLSPLDDALAA